jgi:hypothetical protein
MSERTATITLSESEVSQLLQHLDVSVKTGGLQNSFTAAPLAFKLKEAFNVQAPQPPTELTLPE